MMQKFKSLLWLALCLLAAPAAAQDFACRAAFQSIITLRPPHLGTPPVWDAMYAPAGGAIHLGTGVQVPDGSILAAGQIKSEHAAQLVFATITGRGRVDQEKRLPAPAGDWPVKMLPLKNGYVLLSNIAIAGHQQAKLSWYNKTLTPQQNTILANPTLDLRGTALVMSGDGKSFVVALHGIGRGTTGGEQAIVARFNTTGGKIWQRNFTSGVSNAINGAAPIGADEFLAAGHVRLDDGRLAGWILRIDAHGAMSWQKIYPRGGTADLLTMTPAGTNYLLGGTVTQTGGSATGVWLLQMDVAGDALWQRYLRADKFSLQPLALQTLPNGLALTTINAAGTVKPPTSSSERDHIRLLTFSPRGELASDDTYIEGGGAQAADAAPGADNTRILTANLAPDEKGGPEQGWVFIAPAPAAYKDPCAAK